MDVPAAARRGSRVLEEIFEKRHSGNFSPVAVAPTIVPDEDPLDHIYFTGVAPKFASTRVFIMQLRDMANPYTGLPFRITHCGADFKAHPAACVLNERIHAVRVETVEPIDVPGKILNLKNLFIITFTHGLFEWKVTRTWKRKDIVNLLGVWGIPLLYNLRQKASKEQPQQHLQQHHSQQHQYLQGHHNQQHQHHQQQQHQHPQEQHYQLQHQHPQEQHYQLQHQHRSGVNADASEVHDERRRKSFSSIGSDATAHNVTEAAVLSDINAMLARLESYEVTHGGDSIMNAAILRFLGVSRFSFVEDTGPSLWEGEVTLQLTRNNCPRGIYFWRRKTVWMVIKDSYVAFVKSVVGRVLDLVLVDRAFRYQIAPPATEAQSGSGCCAPCMGGDSSRKVQLTLWNNEL